MCELKFKIESAVVIEERDSPVGSPLYSRGGFRLKNCCNEKELCGTPMDAPRRFTCGEGSLLSNLSPRAFSGHARNKMLLRRVYIRLPVLQIMRRQRDHCCPWFICMRFRWPFFHRRVSQSQFDCGADLDCSGGVLSLDVALGNKRHGVFFSPRDIR